MFSNQLGEANFYHNSSKMKWCFFMDKFLMKSSYMYMVMASRKECNLYLLNI